MTPEEQIALLQRKCERYHREVEAKDDKLADLATTLLGVDAMLQEAIAMLCLAEPHRGDEDEILRMLRDRVKAKS